MNAISGTIDGTVGRAAARRQLSLDLLRPFGRRLARLGRERGATRPAPERASAGSIPSEDELRLIWFCLGRGFDCM